MKEIRNKLESIDDGLFYPLANHIMHGLKWVSLVESFKFLAGICPGPKKTLRRRKSIAIDAFIIFKWALVAYIWSFGCATAFCAAVVWYLLVTNLYTYFYHHVWFSVTTNENGESQEPRERRRFINVILAFCFSAVCYGYFYQVYYASHFTWPAGIDSFTAAMMFSLGTALTGYTGALSPADSVGHFVVATQLIGTFLFLTIILSQSLPQSIAAEKPRIKED